MNLQDVLNILVQEWPVRCSVVLCTSSLAVFLHVHTVVRGITTFLFSLAFGYELATRILYISAGSACELFSLFCALPV